MTYVCLGMIPSPPPRNPQRYHPPAYNLASQMARLHRLGRAHSHEGVTSATVVGDIDIYYPDESEDGK